MSSRKRPKLDPSPDTREASQQPRDQTRNSPAEPPTAPYSPAQGSLRRDLEGQTGNERSESDRQSSKTWYGRTLVHENKARPVTQVAKESINAAVGVTSEAVALARAHTPPLSTDAFRRSLGRQASSTSSRLSLSAATGLTSPTTEKSSINAQSTNTTREEGEIKSKASSVQPISPHDGKQKTVSEDVVKISDVPDEPDAAVSEKTDRPASWFGWLSRPDSQSLSNTETGPSQTTRDKVHEATNLPNDESRNTISNGSSIPAGTDHALSTLSAPNEVYEDQRRSWLRLWNITSSHSQPETDTSSVKGLGNRVTLRAETELNNAKASGDRSTISVKATPMISSANENTKKPTGTSVSKPEAPISKSKSEASQIQSNGSIESGHQRSSSWAFWSRDDGKPRNESGAGEVALAGSPSQSRPEKDILDKKGIPVKVERRQSTATNHREQSLGQEKSPTHGEKRAGSSHESEPAKKAKKPDSAEGKASAEAPNLLLPSFENTYSSLSRPGLVQLLTKWLPFASSLTSPKHLEPTQIPIRIKRALVIGVHGYFPAPLVRTLLGQPTGTSIRFANSAANAIQKWTQAQGYHCEIDKVALEGEGKIADRIETLWGLLLNWIDKIRKADFVLVACHSQGCPVAMMLVAKLLHFGCISSASIGVCAMAGVNQGPFPDYRSRWFGATALELFDFARQDSKVSQGYREALDRILKHGVKILYVGSIDDQLVSLESSTFGIINHPNIYRAVFVDGRVHAPGFLTHLVGFALKLRNLGISDHGLIRELSSPLAGSLYGGEGHSRIYEDEAVYNLAIEHTLKTTVCKGITLHVQAESANSNQNPYILPFAMRGLLEEEYVRTELYREISELIQQFDDWKPASKVLKDVKFRLEGVKSKL